MLKWNFEVHVIYVNILILLFTFIIFTDVIFVDSYFTDLIVYLYLNFYLCI